MLIREYKSDISGEKIEGERFKIYVGYNRSREELEKLADEAIAVGQYKKGEYSRESIIDRLKEQTGVQKKIDCNKAEYEEFKAKYFKAE
ncbi:MAG: hypothetical protein ACTSQ8_24285 [Candidatus Helarchaeota archaeon]